MRFDFNEITNGNFSQTRLSPEQVLAFEVLKRAVRDATDYLCYRGDDEPGAWGQKALSWFLKDEDGYTFTQVCGALNLDRQWTLKMLKHKLKELNGH